MDIRIPLSDMDYGPEEENAVLNVVRSRWLTMGSLTQEFESQFAKLVGAKYAIALSNCTDALHLACVAAGLKVGDEVIVPALTFVASANAVLYTGADVRFADILGLDNFNISPEEIEKNITPRTKAIIVVHYGGHPCQMKEILDIARRHNLTLIEDAAHAPGAFLEGRALGTWGDMGCFSFFSNKNLATGEGGMLVTDRDDIAQRVKILRSHGMTTMTMDRHLGHAFTYDVVELGHNYRIDEIRSSLGLVQLKKLASGNLRRKAITEMYQNGLKKMIDSSNIPFLDPQGQPSYHIFPFLLPEHQDRDMFMKGMRAAGIQTSIHYPPTHRFSYYQKKYPGISLPRTEEISSREVTLPLYPKMSDEDVSYVLSAIRDLLV